MNPEQLIQHVKNRGIELSLTRDFDLRVSANKGILAPNIVAGLRENKWTIVGKLCDYEFQNEVFRVTHPDDIAFVVKKLRYANGRERFRDSQALP